MKLRNYQQIITKNIDSRFRGSAEESRRFVGVKLPTGGGKSFIFMDQLEKVMDEYNSQNENDDSSKLSDVSVKFLAPLNGIIIQTQTNVAKYIILERYIENFQKNNNEINEQNINQAIKEITERMLKSSEIKGKEKKLIIEKINSISIDENNSNEETLRKFLYKVLNLISKKIPVLVKSEFPKVEFICYQNENILKLEEENRESWEETKLVVFDEAHRTGADVWGENVQNLIRTLSDCKFLAITATPERDIDGKDSMADLANIAGYSTRECRKKEYLASDMNLVTALSSNPPLVLKPKVVNFDCMLDRTKEYQDMKTFLDSRKKKANDATIRNGKFTDEYHVLLVNFLTMCKLSGKLDFLKMHLNDSKLEDVLVKFINGEDITSYRRELGEIKEKVYEIDDPKSDLHKEYEEDREKKILDIIKNANCPVGKYICFAPTAKKQAESKEIMESHKAIIQEFLDLPEDKVMITHSNPKVIKPKQDKENLEDFINSSNENIAIVAMDKFNEGMHVDGVVGSFMFRQIDDRGNQSESKEEPKIMFLQQIGRTIRSVDPNNSEQEAPIIFDLACNFMRYNDKLNGIFNISEAQSEFKSLYDESVERLNKEENIQNQPLKKNILEKIIDIMQVLKENEVDISNITSTTKLGDLGLSEDKMEKVLDDIYEKIRERLDSNYKIGARIISARDAFWHKERINEVAERKNIAVGKKKLYNKQTDEFFSTKTFEELYSIGFFEDLNKDNLPESVDYNGFIVGDCADLDRFYGYNVRTGTKYMELEYNNENVEVDIDGFTREKIHVVTGIRYDTRFFRYDGDKGWKNLYTKKDEDLLGYNHEGIMVNPEKGRVGFDRNGLFHEKLEDGSFSRCGQRYDSEGYDVHGFNSNRKTRYNEDTVNGFYRIDGRDGFIVHKNKKTNSGYDENGYDIDGFDRRGFNRDGIHRDTSCRYNKSGIRFSKIRPKDEINYPILRVLNGDLFKDAPEQDRKRRFQLKLTEWIIFYRSYKSSIEAQSNWYEKIDRVYEKEKGIKISDEVKNLSDECKLAKEIIEARAGIEEAESLDLELQNEEDKRQTLLKQKRKCKSEISKLQRDSEENIVLDDSGDYK